MRIMIVGCGSRGSKLAEAADKMVEVKRIYLLDSNRPRVEAVASKLNKGMIVDDIEEELYHCDLVIECATQDVAHDILPKIVYRGVDVMVMSVGALVDDDYRADLIAKAKENDMRIYIPSGAICGIDGLRASAIGELQEVELNTVQGIASFQGVKYIEEKGIDLSGLKERTLLYSGPAREAVKLFPRNVNVAAIVSIIGFGFDKTKVNISVDPATKSNSHELRVKGEFGEMTCNTYNVTSPDNPNTSNLSVFSAISALERIVKNQWIGI